MKQYIYSIIFLFITVTSFAQQDVIFDKKNWPNDKDGFKIAKKNLKQGDELYELDNSGSYQRALEFYLKANQFNPENSMLNYKIGTCYIESTQREKSLEFFQTAYKINKHVAGDINYKLAGALHLNYKFDEAIKEYNNYKRSLSPKDLGLYRTRIEKKVKECEVGKTLVKDPVRVFIDNVGPNINSQYSDYSPLITADESMMIFTSRREGTTGGSISNDDGKYNEDIYISYKENGDWTLAKNIGKPFNTDENDATIGLSSDGQKLFTFREGEILVSELDGEEWSKPRDKELKKVNSDYHESAASFSFDGKTMYYVSDNPETSFGLHDIYISYWD